MIKGNTVIFNEEYISELERFISNTQNKYDNEITPAVRKNLEDKLRTLKHKLDYALDFRENIDEILDIETPRLTAVKTTEGTVLPIRIVKII